MPLMQHPLRTLIRSVLREGDVPDSGMGSRARQLGKIGSVGDKMVALNMQLRQLYIDALDALDDGRPREEYDALVGQIAAIREELNELEILYASMRAELGDG